MPRRPFTSAEHRRLQSTLNRVARTVDDGHIAWQEGRLDPGHIDAIAMAQQEIAQELAHFRDRQYVLCDSTLDWMLTYEIMASDLLDGMESLKGERYEERIRMSADKYAVSRQLLLDGRLYQEARLATNPAVATAYLDQWEQDVRNSVLHVAA